MERYKLIKDIVIKFCSMSLPNSSISISYGDNLAKCKICFFNGNSCEICQVPHESTVSMSSPFFPPHERKADDKTEYTQTMEGELIDAMFFLGRVDSFETK